MGKQMKLAVLLLAALVFQMHAELQINEKVSSWKDIALLKRELREYQRQLSEKESRMDMLKGILEDGE